MSTTNKINFINQEKTTRSTTTSPTWSLQGRMLDGNKLTGNHNYLMVSWVNCTSPGNNDGATKFAFEGGDDIEGSVQQRHDTNSAGMAVQHIGQFIAPSPPKDIGVYRRRVFDGGEVEGTDYGQCFAIDLDYVGASGGLISGSHFASSTDHTTRTKIPGGTFHTHTQSASGGNHLIFAACKCYDSTDSVLVSLLVDDVLIASGSKYVHDAYDVKTIVFGISQDLASGSTIKFRNDDANVATANYTYIFTLNLDASPTTQATGNLTSWTDYSSSGSWGSKTINGNNDTSFVVGMGRQIATGVESGRMAAISLKNNTTDEWLLFPNRPSGAFNSLYFPSTNPEANRNQRETAVIVGVGSIGNNSEIEMVSL